MPDPTREEREAARLEALLERREAGRERLAFEADEREDQMVDAYRRREGRDG